MCIPFHLVPQPICHLLADPIKDSVLLTHQPSDVGVLKVEKYSIFCLGKNTKFSKLKNALEYAKSMFPTIHTIVLGKGTFDHSSEQDGAILVDFPITIKGQGVGSTIINGCFVIGTSQLTRVDSNNNNANLNSKIVMYNLTITKAKNCAILNAAGLDLTVHTCEISRCREYGIGVFQGALINLIASDVHLNTCGLVISGAGSTINMSNTECRQNRNSGIQCTQNGEVHIWGEKTKIWKNVSGRDTSFYGVESFGKGSQVNFHTNYEQVCFDNGGGGDRCEREGGKIST